MRFRDIKKRSKNKNITKDLENKISYVATVDRIKAFITDMFMIYTPILYLITYVFMNGKDDFQSSQIAPLLGVALYALVYAILISKFAQTPGNKAYNMKVVDATTHKNISFIRALIRFFIFLFSATIIFGLLTTLYRKDKKTLHDMVVDTIVINE
jgi:uncharacterized RDD family membrane protein YckC